MALKFNHNYKGFIAIDCYAMIRNITTVKELKDVEYVYEEMIEVVKVEPRQLTQMVDGEEVVTNEFIEVRVQELGYVPKVKQEKVFKHHFFVEFYKDETKSIMLEKKAYGFETDIFVQDNFFQIAYGYLKTKEEFLNSEDC